MSWGFSKRHLLIVRGSISLCRQGRPAGDRGLTCISMDTPFPSRLASRNRVIREIDLPRFARPLSRANQHTINPPLVSPWISSMLSTRPPPSIHRPRKLITRNSSLRCLKKNCRNCRNCLPFLSTACLVVLFVLFVSQSDAPCGRGGGKQAGGPPAP